VASQNAFEPIPGQRATPGPMPRSLMVSLRLRDQGLQDGQLGPDRRHLGMATRAFSLCRSPWRCPAGGVYEPCAVGTRAHEAGSPANRKGPPSAAEPTLLAGLREIDASTRTSSRFPDLVMARDTVSSLSTHRSPRPDIQVAWRVKEPRRLLHLQTLMLYYPTKPECHCRSVLRH